MTVESIYIRFKGKVLGPFPDAKVRTLVSRGQVTRMHELSADGISWQRAEDFADFFSGGASSVAATQQSVPVNGDGSSQPIPGQAADDGVEWYANINDQNRGPIKTTGLIQLIESGDVDRETAVWRAGLDEWQLAGAALPDQFMHQAPEQIPNQFPAASIVAGDQSEARSDRGGEVLPKNVVEVMVAQRPWVLTIAIVGLIWSGITVVYFVTAMIVGAESRWLPGGGSVAVVYGLLGLIFCGIMIGGQMLLLNYGSRLKALARKPDHATLGLAAKQLNSFWRYCGIVIITVLSIILALVILSVVMAAAAAGAATGAVS